MPASSPSTVAEKHFQELFREADSRIRAVRIGDDASLREAGRALALAEDIAVDTLSSDSRATANPHFSEMLRFVTAVETGGGGDRADDPATQQYDTVLAASLKLHPTRPRCELRARRRSAGGAVAGGGVWCGCRATARGHRVPGC